MTTTETPTTATTPSSGVYTFFGDQLYFRCFGNVNGDDDDNNNDRSTSDDEAATNRQHHNDGQPQQPPHSLQFKQPQPQQSHNNHQPPSHRPPTSRVAIHSEDTAATANRMSVADDDAADYDVDEAPSSSTTTPAPAAAAMVFCSTTIDGNLRASSDVDYKGVRRRQHFAGTRQQRQQRNRHNHPPQQQQQLMERHRCGHIDQSQRHQRHLEHNRLHLQPYPQHPHNEHSVQLQHEPNDDGDDDENEVVLEPSAPDVCSRLSDSHMDGTDDDASQRQQRWFVYDDVDESTDATRWPSAARHSLLLFLSVCMLAVAAPGALAAKQEGKWRKHGVSETNHAGFMRTKHESAYVPYVCREQSAIKEQNQQTTQTDKITESSAFWRAFMTGCTFPARWEGSWFLSGNQQPVHIKGSTLSFRGKCIATEGDKFLVVDE